MRAGRKELRGGEEDNWGCAHCGTAQRQMDPDDGVRRGRAAPRPWVQRRGLRKWG